MLSVSWKQFWQTRLQSRLWNTSPKIYALMLGMLEKPLAKQ